MNWVTWIALAVAAAVLLIALTWLEAGVYVGSRTEPTTVNQSELFYTDLEKPAAHTLLSSRTRADRRACRPPLAGTHCVREDLALRLKSSARPNRFSAAR
jgi:hypothetical protein